MAILGRAPPSSTFPPDVGLALTPATPWTGGTPTYLQWYYQPEFAAEIIRVADRTVFGTASNNVRHFYSKTQPWSSDGGKLLLSFNPASYVIDGNTYAYLNSLDLSGTNLINAGTSGTSADAKWANQTANVIYSTVSNTLISINATTGARTTLHTFSAYTLVSMGYQEGNQSDDDRYFAIMGKTAGGNYTLAVYDLQQDSVGTGLNLTTLGDDTTLDWFGMSHSGLYVGVLYHTANKFSIYDKNMTFVRDLIANSDHCDFAYDQAGNECLVMLYEDTSNNYIESWPLSGAAKTRCLTTAWTGDMHISGRNYGRPGWIYVSSYRGGLGLPFEKEVCAVKLDSSQTVEHFIHSYNATADAGVYANQAQACPDRTGTRVIVASDWGVTGGPYYSYVAGYDGRFMGDNTTLNPGSSGDVIRDLQRQAGGPKTQIVALDLGGAAAYPENLINAGQDIAANSLPVIDASDDPKTALLARIADLLTQLLPANPGMGTPSPFEQLAASIISILQGMSPWQVQATAANVPASPLPAGAIQLTGASGVQSNAVASAFLTAPLGKTVYITGFVAGGLGATAAGMGSVTIFNIVGGSLAFAYPIPAGVGVAGPIAPVLIQPPLVATGPNVNIQVNLSALGSGNVGGQITITGYAV